MTTENKIIRYLQDISKGMVNITADHAKAIIKLVQPSQLKPVMASGAAAKLLRYNGQNGCWDPFRVIQTTDEKINARIKEALEIPPVEGFYKYELYNSAGEFEGNIFTANNSLFDNHAAH